MSKKVLITETILRDAHQSQSATRMKTEEMIPDDADEFIKKIESTFNDEDSSDETMQKLTDLCKTDPEFVNQMIALQEVYSAVKIYEDEEASENRK